MGTSTTRYSPTATAHVPRDVPSRCLRSIPKWIAELVERGHGQPVASVIPQDLTYAYIEIRWRPWLALPRRPMSSTPLAMCTAAKSWTALIAGEKAVGAIETTSRCPSLRFQKHLRVLSEVGLVRCRAEGRRRLYRLEPEHLRPLHEWVVSTSRRGTTGWIGWMTTYTSYKHKESFSDT